MPKRQPISNQTVANIGLFYVCYCLSRRDWNVMPTALNARGVDILIYSQDAARTRTIQVKTLSKASAVPLVSRPMNNLIYLATGLIFMSIGRKEDEDGPWTSVAPLAVRGGALRQGKDFLRHIETFVAQYPPHARPFTW